MFVPHYWTVYITTVGFINNSSGRFGRVPFSLPLVPDGLYAIRVVFSVNSHGNPS